MKCLWESPKALPISRAAVALTAFALSSASLFCRAQSLAQANSVLPIAPSALRLTKAAASTGSVSISSPATASVNGTVTDTNGALIPGATVEIDSSTPDDTQTVLAGNDGTFQLNALKPGVTYVVHLGTDGAAAWTSEPIILQPQ